MRQLYQIQAQLLTSPPPLLDPNIVAVKFIGVCAANANVRHALQLLLHLQDPNIYVYNALLKALSQNNHFEEAVRIFESVLLSKGKAGILDEYSFTSFLKACTGLENFDYGKKAHGYVEKLGMGSNVFVVNCLVDMYAKMGRLDIAHKLFDEMSHTDLVSWNTLISGYCLNGLVDEARVVFDRLAERSFVSWSTMISGYMKAGMVEHGKKLFEEMGERNIVCWNALIGGYAQNAKYGEAIKSFRRMQEEEVGPNDITLVSVLSACAHLGALDLGKWVDGYVGRSGRELGLFLGNALVDMYCKCGCLLEAKRVFHKMKQRDSISWSIIIMGAAMHGHTEEAFGYFDEMIKCGDTPGDITFMGLLTACAHVGCVDKGLEYFNRMEDYGVPPKIEHYGCVVDLLSRAGRLNEAENLIRSMPLKPNVIVWGSLLAGCRTYKDTTRGDRAVKHILELDSDHSGSYVYLANVYASMGRLDDAAKCRLRMRKNGVTKTPGCSWIEVDNMVHEFLMGDTSHPQSDKIYSMVRELRWRMKLEGYKPKIDLVVHGVDEEEKEDALSLHSEKLAIAFRLISTPKGTTIRIVKNLRVCHDCHDATKVISRIVGREIIVRDRSHFHLFKNGICSCNDYW